MTDIRTHKKHARYERILLAAVEVAKTDTVGMMARKPIAIKAGVAAGSVHFAFGNMKTLREEVVRYASANGEHTIVMQALAHPSLAHLVTCDARDAAIASLTPCTTE